MVTLVVMVMRVVTVTHVVLMNDVMMVRCKLVAHAQTVMLAAPTTPALMTAACLFEVSAPLLMLSTLQHTQPSLRSSLFFAFWQPARHSHQSHPVGD